MSATSLLSEIALTLPQPMMKQDHNPPDELGMALIALFVTLLSGGGAILLGGISAVMHFSKNSSGEEIAAFKGIILLWLFGCGVVAIGWVLQRKYARLLGMLLGVAGIAFICLALY